MIRPLDLSVDRSEFWRMRCLLHPSLEADEEEAEMAGVTELLASRRYAVFVHVRLGAALVDAAMKWARARGLSELGSDTLVDNQVSIRAHQALGFEAIETQICFLKKL